MQQIWASNHAGGRQLADNANISSERYRLNLKILGGWVAQATTIPSLFDAAYATSCDPGDGLRGLKYDIVEFEIICDAEICGVASGENLASSGLIYVNYSAGSSEELSTTEWIK